MSVPKSFLVLVLAVAGIYPAPLPLAQEEDRIEEIIVSVEKRNKSLQEMSQSVTVFGSDDIISLDVDSIVDLNALSPGVNISKNEGSNTVITIRGVGNEANQNVIASPSVSYHVDGIYLASDFSLLTDLLDIERIEVVRGPQGSIFGQNSTGGMINVVTGSPDLGFRYGSVSTTVGTHSLFKTRAIANIPLGDSVSLRTALSSNRHDGFSENVLLGQDLDDSRNITGRVKLLWDKTPAIMVQVTAQKFKEDTNGPAQKGILDDTPNPRKLKQDSESRYMLDASLLSLAVSRDTSFGNFKYLASYQESWQNCNRDNDRTAIVSNLPGAPPPAYIAPENNSQTTKTQEIQWLSNQNASSKYSHILGAFWLDTSFDVMFREQIDFGRDGVFDYVSVEQVRNFELGDYGFIGDAIVERSSVSLYGQTSYQSTPTINLVGGLRYTDDQVSSVVENFYGRSGKDFLAISGNSLTGRATIEYTTRSDTLIYTTYARGFKPGGSNLTYGQEADIAPPFVFSTYVDEIVDILEFGVKLTLPKGRGLFNSVVYLSDYRNMQYQATDPEVFAGGVGNIPKVSLRGVEMEFLIWATNNLRFKGGLALSKSEITKDHFAIDNVDSDQVTNSLLAQGYALFSPEIQQARAASVMNVRGNDVAKAPGFTGNATVHHFVRDTPLGEIQTGIQLVHRGKYYHRIFNNAVTDRVKSYSILNVSISVSPSASPWSVHLTLLNAFDEAGVNSRFTDAFGVGATSVELIPPRQILFRAELSFNQ